LEQGQNNIKRFSGKSAVRFKPFPSVLFMTLKFAFSQAITTKRPSSGAPFSNYLDKCFGFFFRTHVVFSFPFSSKSLFWNWSFSQTSTNRSVILYPPRQTHGLVSSETFPLAT
jgi:hypothetical protein